jgi:hypothetical protein
MRQLQRPNHAEAVSGRITESSNLHQTRHSSYLCMILLQLWAKQAAQLPEIQSLYGEEVKSCRFDTNWVQEFKKTYNIPVNSSSSKDKQSSYEESTQIDLPYDDTADHGANGAYYSQNNVFLSDNHDIPLPESPSPHFPLDALGTVPQLQLSDRIHDVPTGIVVGAMNSTAADPSYYRGQEYMAAQPMPLVSHADTISMRMHVANISSDLWENDANVNRFASWQHH